MSNSYYSLNKEQSSFLLFWKIVEFGLLFFI